MAAEHPDTRADIADEVGLAKFELLLPNMTREKAERISRRDRIRTFGALPHFDQLDEHLRGVRDDRKFLDSLGKEKIAEKQREALLTYRLKFGTSLCELLQRVLAHYEEPPSNSGEIISIYGLPGSGKSLVTDILRQKMPDVVAVHTDAARLNLFGAIVADVEQQYGAQPQEVQLDLIYSDQISGMLYLVLETVACVLRERGYTVVQCGASPTSTADRTYYLEHPDVDVEMVPSPYGAPPDEVAKKRRGLQRAVHTATRSIAERRQNTTNTFSWQDAQQITDFKQMKPSIIPIPERIFERLILSTKKALEQWRDEIIFNGRAYSRDEARPHLFAQLRQILGRQ